MTEFNPEITHEARELYMHADDAIAAALQEAFAILEGADTEDEGHYTDQLGDQLDAAEERTDKELAEQGLSDLGKAIEALW